MENEKTKDNLNGKDGETNRSPKSSPLEKKARYRKHPDGTEGFEMLQTELTRLYAGPFLLS